MTRRLDWAVFALVMTILASVSLATRAQAAAVLDLLKQPGVHAIMRHARAPGTGDPTAFSLHDCATQRNLDSRGRDQARAIGKAFKDAGLTFDRILTSQWCRCRETAGLIGLGKPVDFPALNSFFQDRATADDQTRQLTDFLISLPDSEKILFVTHQVNITALTGRGVASGEVFLIKKNEAGRLEVVGEFLIGP